MADFDKYFDKLQKNLEDLVRNNWKDFIDAAGADGQAGNRAGREARAHQDRRCRQSGGG